MSAIAKSTTARKPAAVKPAASVSLVRSTPRAARVAKPAAATLDTLTPGARVVLATSTVRGIYRETHNVVSVADGHLVLTTLDNGLKSPSPAQWHLRKSAEGKWLHGRNEWALSRVLDPADPTVSSRPKAA